MYFSEKLNKKNTFVRVLFTVNGKTFFFIRRNCKQLPRELQKGLHFCHGSKNFIFFKDCSFLLFLKLFLPREEMILLSPAFGRNQLFEAIGVKVQILKNQLSSVFNFR